MTVQAKTSIAWKKRSFQLSIYRILTLQKSIPLSVARLMKTASQKIKSICIKQKIFEQHGYFLVAPLPEKSHHSPPQPPCGLRNIFGSSPLKQQLV